MADVLAGNSTGEDWLVGSEQVDGHLELWTSEGRSLLLLTSARCTIGSSAQSDLVVDDRSVSAVHAHLELLGGTWFVEDLGSRNGTFVNGQRTHGRSAVRPGDEIRLGLARLTLRGMVRGASNDTQVADEPPVLTRREREVLVTLCQPLLSGDPFTEPAASREIAALLFVSEAAVKQHLANLYGKFGVDEGDRRRVRLANAALSSGAVSLSDLRRDG